LLSGYDVLGHEELQYQSIILTVNDRCHTACFIFASNKKTTSNSVKLRT
jgi:hypothetical protein